MVSIAAHANVLADANLTPPYATQALIVPHYPSSLAFGLCSLPDGRECSSTCYQFAPKYLAPAPAAERERYKVEQARREQAMREKAEAEAELAAERDAKLRAKRDEEDRAAAEKKAAREEKKREEQKARMERLMRKGAVVA